MKFILSLCLFLTTVKTTIAQVYYVQNGLYKPDASTVRWGGPLTENTTIDLSSSFFFNFSKGGTDYFKISNNGNIGIGSSDPSAPLSLGGSLANSKIALWEGGVINGVKMRYGLGIASYQFRLHLDAPAARFSFLSDEAGSTELMTILGTGNVGIGTTNPQGKLAVKGTVYATKVIVTANGWSDYVFYPSYTLRPLPELEQYILQQQHLPEIPTADEVQKNGIDVGDNQALLLKKIEELTLYVIDLNKQVKKQQEEISKLNRQLNK
jgi:hypothetical protein